MKEKKGQKSGIQNLVYYKNELMTILIALGGILGFIGSYQYFSSILSGYKVWAASIYSTFKLFFFVPIIPLDADYPLIYEIAKWIAPTGTILGLFSIFGNFFYRLRQGIRSVGAKRYIVFGNGEDAVKLLSNILKEEERAVGYLISQKIEFKQTREDLLKRRISVTELNFNVDPAGFVLGKLRDIHIEKAEAIIFFDEDVRNYANIKALIPYLKKKKEGYKIVVKYETEDFKEMMENDMESKEEVEIKFFHLEKAMANEFLDRVFDIENIVSYKKDNKVRRIEDVGNLSDICTWIGELHIMIVGFEKLGQSVLLESLNQLVINPEKKIRFTIIDKKINALFEDFTGEYRYLDKMADIERVEGSVLQKNLLAAIEEINKKNRVDILIFTIDNYKNSIIALNRFKRILSKPNVAIKVHESGFMHVFEESLKNYYNDILFYGNDDMVFCKKFVLEEDIAERAMDFNARYNKKAAQITGGEIPEQTAREQWEKLSSIKKESSLSQIYHRDTKIKLIRYFMKFDLKDTDLEGFIGNWETTIEGEDIGRQIDIIKKDALMNFLSALEHRRWCNFYYIKNFSYSKKKDEDALKHDCLIPDWNEFLVSEKADLMIYDFISVLNIV